MPAFEVGDLVKVTPNRFTQNLPNLPNMGFIDSITEGLYTIEYLNDTTEANVKRDRLKKQSMPATVHGRPALITDRRMLRGETAYKYSVMYTDSWNENPNRVDMVDLDKIGPPTKGGRTRRLRKAKKSKKRTRRR